MRQRISVIAVVVLGSALAFAWRQSARAADEPAQVQVPADWSMNATIIEACSCPMFCQCYFDTKPAAHPAGDEHAEHAEHATAAAGHEGHNMAGMSGSEMYCKFNNAYKINHGNWGDTKLDGAKFWASGDLGSDFGSGSIPWLMVTFDPAVTKEQREGIKYMVGKIYPVTPKQFVEAADKSIEWTATKDRAEAKLDGGKAAEVVLKKNQGMSDEPIVIKNLKYFGAPRNDGFIMMQNEVEALHQAPEGQKPYEYKGTNGFMITLDINSKDYAQEHK